MGVYLNPGNEGFQRILQSEYVDKTGLIALLNQTIGTMEMLSCISRPRRFCKSYAAKMLCAYYDCSCDSRELFDDKEIAGEQGYLTHLNKYPCSLSRHHGLPLRGKEAEETYGGCTRENRGCRP